MEIDTSNLTDEQISKLNEFIHTMEKENEETKWWIIAKYTPFSDGLNYEKYGPCYYVEPEKDAYSKSRPPLKSGFSSEEEAVKWLSDYLKEEDLFLKAEDELDNLVCNLGHIKERLMNHNKVSKVDWLNCFNSFYNSLHNGTLKEVTVE